MVTTAGVHGKFTTFEFPLATVITGITEISGIGVGEAPLADSTVMGDTAQTNLKGIPGAATFTVSGLAATGTTDHGGLATKAAGSDVDGDTFGYYPEGNTSLKGKVTGTAHCLSYVQSSSFGGAVQWTATFGITGALVFGTVT